VSKGAPEAAELIQFGLLEGSGNVHPGQGTANRRFFFENAMLELLWLADPDEARNELTRPTGLFERCSLNDPTVSPFGICFRPSSEHETTAPFPTWDYKPGYLPDSLKIEISTAHLPEPMWFFADFFKPKPSNDWKEPVEHPAGLERLTNVVVHFPMVGNVPAGMDECTALQCKPAASHLLELEFDGGAKQNAHDFRPALPLVIKW
jgi:hypothetical protein